jgi:peptide subunit release factor 1 (eRF1)
MQLAHPNRLSEVEEPSTTTLREPTSTSRESYHSPPERGNDVLYDCINHIHRNALMEYTMCNSDTCTSFWGSRHLE